MMIFVVDSIPHLLIYIDDLLMFGDIDYRWWYSLFTLTIVGGLVFYLCADLHFVCCVTLCPFYLTSFYCGIWACVCLTFCSFVVLCPIQIQCLSLFCTFYFVLCYILSMCYIYFYIPHLLVNHLMTLHWHSVLFNYLLTSRWAFIYNSYLFVVYIYLCVCVPFSKWLFD